MADFNVVRDYDWTSTPRGSGMREQAPNVFVKSYKIKSNEALNRLKSYVNIATQVDAKTFYDKLYGNIAEPEDTFRFPYFSDDIRSFGNNYGDTFQVGMLGALDTVAGAAIKMYGGYNAMDPGYNAVKLAENAVKTAKEVGEQAAGGNMPGLKEISGMMTSGMASKPGSYIETPQMYQYDNTDAGLQVSFVLANTINSDFNKNTELVKKLTTINRPKRLNSIEMEPPRIYEVRLKGQRYIKWASCSQFTASMIGTKRLINGVIVPEGYQISMTLTSLTTEVNNFMDDI